MDFSTEVAAFHRKLPELLRSYPGQYVSFVGDEFVVASPDAEIAWEAGLARRPDGNVFVRQVLEGPQVVMLPFVFG